MSSLINGDCLQILQSYQGNTFDLIVTDPPYGISFMGKDWDKALPDPKIWQECFRVLKDGKFAFIMCSPRQDVLSRMIISLEDAGFRTNYTSMYHTFASGFPKALNLEKHNIKCGKALSESQLRNMWKTIVCSTKCNEEDNDRRIMQTLLENMEQGTQYKIHAYTRSESESSKISKRQYESCMERWNMLSEKERELSCKCKICKMPIGVYFNGKERWLCHGTQTDNGSVNWQVFDKNGVCSSYQSQPIRQSFRELDVICEQCITQKVRESGISGGYRNFQPKPAVEVILVLSKGSPISWLDDCRIPYSSDADKQGTKTGFKGAWSSDGSNEGWQRESHKNYEVMEANQKGRFPANLLCSDDVLNDGKIYKSGDINPHKINGTSSMSYPRYAKEITTTSKGDSGSYSRYFSLDSWAKTFPFLIVPKASKSERGEFNKHPTVKALKLMSYLVTLGSREGDLVLDPFMGSGTTCIAAQTLHRNYVGIEVNEEYYKIAQARLSPYLEQTKLV